MHLDDSNESSGRESLPPSYKIGEHVLNYVNKIKYLGMNVIMQLKLQV